MKSMKGEKIYFKADRWKVARDMKTYHTLLFIKEIQINPLGKIYHTKCMHWENKC
jgi:hypothetical protein